MKTSSLLSRGLAVAGVLAVASACGTAQRKAMETERLLAAAGFQMRMQDTPEEATDMAGLPQREIFHHQRDGEMYFVYADQEYCKCIYVGTPKAYQRYEKMAIEQKIARARLSAARAQQSAALSWGAWGPWYRPWY